MLVASPRISQSSSCDVPGMAKSNAGCKEALLMQDKYTLRDRRGERVISPAALHCQTSL